MSPRYPQLRLSLASENPLAWVSAVRQALRRSGADRPEVDRFSAEAFAESEPEAVREVCAAWAVIEGAGIERGGIEDRPEGSEEPGLRAESPPAEGAPPAE